MSLTSLLQAKDVKERFRVEFNKPPFPVKSSLRAPPLTHRSSLVGTAFDYLFRFYLKRLNPFAAEPPWIAEHVVHLPSLSNRPDLRRLAERTVARGRKARARFLSVGELDDDVLTSVLLLAQLDPMFRAGVVDRELGRVDQDDLVDLRSLVGAVDWQFFRARHVCLLDPTFGPGVGTRGRRGRGRCGR